MMPYSRKQLGRTHMAVSRNASNSVAIRIQSAPEVGVFVGNTYSYDVDAFSSIIETITYSLDTSPAGMTIVGNSIEWVNATPVGVYLVKIRATGDISGASSTQEYNLNVV